MIDKVVCEEIIQALVFPYSRYITIDVDLPDMLRGFVKLRMVVF